MTPRPYNNVPTHKKILDEANEGNITGVYYEYYKPVLYYAMALAKRSAAKPVPEDVAATAFAKLHSLIQANLSENNRRFDSMHQIKTWLNKTTRTTFLDECDKLNSKQERMELSFSPIDEEMALMESEVMDVIDRNDLLTIIDALPPDLRAAIKKRYLEGYNLRETADHLSLCENATSGRLKRAIRRIQDVFHRELGLHLELDIETNTNHLKQKQKNEKNGAG